MALGGTGGRADAASDDDDAGGGDDVFLVCLPDAGVAWTSLTLDDDVRWAESCGRGTCCLPLEVAAL